MNCQHTHKKSEGDVTGRILDIFEYILMALFFFSVFYMVSYQCSTLRSIDGHTYIYNLSGKEGRSGWLHDEKCPKCKSKN